MPAQEEATPAAVESEPPTVKSLDKRPLMKRLGKLVTREDPVHLHKTLGLLSLVHYLYRYCVVYPRTGELGFENPGVKAWFCVALHMALSTSSLIFTVMKTRILDKPTIIWEEYRLHAIVFTLRATSVFVFQAVWPAIEDPNRPGRFGSDLQVVALYCLVFAHHLVVDQITVWYGVKGESTVRGDGKRAGPKFKRLMRFYAFYQFIALGSHLTVHRRGCDIGWNPIIAIQSSAFCMTLYRKRLIRGKTHAAIYSICLIVSALHIIRMLDGYSHFLLKVGIVFLLRVQFGMDKYLLWAGYSISLMPSVQDAVARVSLETIGLDFGGHDAAANASIAGGNASAASTFQFPAHDDMLGRTGALCVLLYALLVMRKDERNYPKDVADLKRIAEEVRLKKVAQLEAEKKGTKKTA